ncbi:MAG: hypothetical protein FWB96_08280 [Defluviitaleaceae bacterium]|nr:hypothetical protein [Defluviitaleaceae bacterium]MCL2224947.1 hypothetical protein [Defluviitaleaceae bacterium]MCL2262492.1 hypothetical protein [Defluviitaleaceae bacterium]
MVKKQRKSKATLLGTTTLRRMVSASFNEGDALYSRNTYAECFMAKWRLDDKPADGDEIVYVYYHAKEDETIMTNIEDDIWGAMGSSAGFKGKLKPAEFSDVSVCERSSAHDDQQKLTNH